MRHVRHVDVVYEPVVERPVVLELERAYRVRDALDGVLVAVREVVHRVDAPFRSGAVMLALEYSVDDWVAHVEVFARHVYLRAKDVAALLELAGGHAREEVEVLLDAAVSVGRVDAGLSQRAAVRAYLLRALVVDVGLAGFDEVYRPLVELLEIIGGVAEVGPLEAEPLDVLHYRLDVLRLFLRGVRVVEAQVAASAEFLRRSEVKAYRLRMSDVQVAVRFRREARDDLLDAPALDVRGDDLFDEIQIFVLRSHKSSLHPFVKIFQGSAREAPPGVRRRSITLNMIM